MFRIACFSSSGNAIQRACLRSRSTDLATRKSLVGAATPFHTTITTASHLTKTLHIPKLSFSSSTANKHSFTSSFSLPKTTDLNFTEFLLDDALERHKEPALIDTATGEVTTYGKLKEAVNDMAIQYYIRGWEQNNPIAVIIKPNHYIYPITVLGAARVGMPTVLIDTSLKARDMGRQMKLTNVNHIITHNSIIQYIRDASATLRTVKEILVIDKEDEPKDKKDVRWTMEMKYNLLFRKPPGWGAIPDWTITTTSNMIMLCNHSIDNGEPTLKASALQQKSMICAVLALKLVEPDLTSTDVVLSALPLHHILGILITLYPFFVGAKSVVLDSTEITKFVSTVKQHKVTFAHLSANQLRELAESNAADLVDNLASLKTVLVGDLLEEKTLDAFQARFKNVKVKQAYTVNGLTPPLTYTPSPLKHSKRGSFGVLLPGMEAKILDSNTGEELGVNVEGELHMKGPLMMAHLITLLLRPDAPKVKPSEPMNPTKWMKTGDRARVDEDGYLWVVPKKEEVVEKIE